MNTTEKFPTKHYTHQFIWWHKQRVFLPERWIINNRNRIHVHYPVAKRRNGKLVDVLSHKWAHMPAHAVAVRLKYLHRLMHINGKHIEKRSNREVNACLLLHTAFTAGITMENRVCFERGKFWCAQFVHENIESIETIIHIQYPFNWFIIIIIFVISDTCNTLNAVDIDYSLLHTLAV